MIHRQNNVLKTSNSLPDFAVSYTVLALPVGAVAAAASSGTTATVDAGHGFKAGDKVLIYNSSGATYVAEALASVGAAGTTLVWSSATPTIAKYDLLCNLGPDSSSGATPAYTASPMYIFSDAGGGDTITNSTVTTDTFGNYDYWSRGDGRNWELIRTGSTVVGVVPGWGGVGGQLNPCDFGCIADSTGDNGTDNQARLQVCIDAAANAGFTFRGPSGNFAVQNRLLLPANFRAVNDPMFKLVKRWSAAGASLQTALLVSKVYATAATGASTSDDNIHWEGGRLTVGAANTYRGSMFGIHSNYGVVQNIVIEEWGLNGTNGGMAGHLYGNYGWIRNVQAYSSMTSGGGTDGLGRAAGKGGGIVGCVVKSADDCYTTTVWEGGGVANIAVTDMVIADCYGECTQAGANVYRAYNSAGTTANVERITIKNLTGSSVGKLISISQEATSSGQIKNITIDGVVGIPATGGTPDRIVWVNGSVGTGSYQISDVHISNLHAPVSSNAAPDIGPVYFFEVNRGSFSNNRIDASGMNRAMTTVVYVQNCKNVAFDRNTILMSQTQAMTTVRAFWFGAGSASVNGLSCCDNIILDVPSNGYGIDNEESTNYVICGNIIKIQGTGPVIGIYDGGGTVEGNGIVANNNLSDWLALEAADKLVPSAAPTNDAIWQLDEGDTSYIGNVGHNLVGVESYTASATQTQIGGTFLRAALCIVTVGAQEDTVTLPYAIPGRRITIMNTSTAYDLKIYPANSDGIFGQPNNTAIYLRNAAGAGTATFVARNNTAWVLESASTEANVATTATP